MNVVIGVGVWYPFGFGSGISDFWVLLYRGVEPVQVFLYFGSGSGMFTSDSIISDRFRYLDFEIKKIKILFFKFLVFKNITFT